ncbi:MAG: VOC family protein [Chloroflexota bacterium]
MYKVTSYPHGTFSWADCNSTNQVESTKFLKTLMGWEHEDMPMGDGEVYTMLKQDGETVAASSPMPKEMLDNSVPSHWQNYITVTDVDALVDKVTELGGTVVAPPFDVFDSGRMMAIQDPTGATVNLWQTGTHIGAGLVNTVGAMMWNELTTPDVQKATDFYGGLLGWQFQKDDNQDYWYILNNGRMNGGISPMVAEMGDLPPMWTVYYNVADIEASKAKVKELGGHIHMEGTAEGIGSFALIADSTGATFYIMQPEMVEAWEESESTASN